MLKGPKMLKVQNHLRLTTSHFKEAAKVRPYEKTRHVLKSDSNVCVRDLGRMMFGPVPVQAFIVTLQVLRELFEVWTLRFLPPKS